MFLKNGNGETLSQVVYLAINRKNLAGMMVGDLWLMNKDRTEDNLIIIHQQAAHAVDFGRIPGGPAWTVDSLKQHSNDFDDWPFKHAVDPASIVDFLERLEGLGPDRILSVIALVPDEWVLSEEEKDAILHFLLHRQPLVRAHIAKLGL